MTVFWIIYLIFLFAAVILVYNWALRWFYRNFKNKRRL